MNFEQIKKLLDTPKKILVTMHSRPDADALGSSLALGNVLKKIGHKVEIIAPTEFPEFLNWLDGIDKVKIFSEQSKECLDIIEKSQIIFCLDFSSLDRLDIMSKYIEESSSIKIVIDHHIDPKPFYDHILWNPNASATAVLVYQFLKELDFLKYISNEVADSLYSGILTDTGSFQHPTTTIESHLVTAELIKRGANISEVNRNIFNTNSINRIKFLGFAISNRLVILENYHAAYFVIKKTDYEDFQLKIGDTEGLVNYALSIKGINFAALVSDLGKYIRLSLRSKGEIKVNEIAKDYFSGGGHKNAAGGKSYENLDITIEKLETIIKNKL